MMATIRFNHEVAQRGTLFHMPRNVADDYNASPVGDKFLKERAGHACSEPKKIVVEPRGGNHNQIGTMRLANQVGCVRSFSPSGAHAK
jgi:hypothetical protein